jgi:hypothetical protein
LYAKATIRPATPGAKISGRQLQIIEVRLLVAEAS